MQTLGISARLRGAVVCLALVAAAGTLAATVPSRLAKVRVDLGGARSGGVPDPAVVDHVLVLGAWVALLAAACWAALLALAACGQAGGSARAGRALHRWCPPAWRRPLCLACGVAVAASLPTVAVGADRETPDPLAGLPGLDRPVGAPTPGRAPARRPSVPAVRPPGRPQVVVVRPGDSLWRLVAARHPAADAADVVRRVGALYRANRAVIGDDPDLIHPGQRLRVSDRPPGPAGPDRTRPRRNR